MATKIRAAQDICRRTNTRGSRANAEAVPDQTGTALKSSALRWGLQAEHTPEYYLASLPDGSGRITVEWLAGCSWNQWPNDRGIHTHADGDVRAPIFLSRFDMI